MINEFLSRFKIKKLITLNAFVKKDVTLSEIKKYATLLSRQPKRTDFIPYDDDGNIILNHKPLFKGWAMCSQTSSEKFKVAKMNTVGNHYRIYFDTKNGVEMMSLTHSADNVTYNDLAILFEGHLELE